jgi:hypothetical protein
LLSTQVLVLFAADLLNPDVPATGFMASSQGIKLAVGRGFSLAVSSAATFRSFGFAAWIKLGSTAAATVGGNGGRLFETVTLDAESMRMYPVLVLVCFR